MAAPRRSKEEQLQLVHECRSSGLTTAEWCRREGILVNTYYTWIERLIKRGLMERPVTIPQRVITGPIAPEIIKVQVEQAAAPALVKGNPDRPIPIQEERCEKLQSIGNGAVMEIDIHGIRIRVTNDIQPQLLAESFRVIGGVLNVR